MSATTDWITAVSGAFAAVGTVGAVVVALFPEQLRRRLMPTSAEITLADPDGEIASIAVTEHRSAQVVMHHLRIRNLSKLTLRRCTLAITEISRKAADGQFVTTTLAVPQYLRWAPAPIEPLAIDVPAGHSAIADFGMYRDVGPSAMFLPLLHGGALNFPGNIERQGTCRYEVVLRAENLDRPARALIQVTTTGGWGIDADSMRMQVTVERLAPR